METAPKHAKQPPPVAQPAIGMTASDMLERGKSILETEAEAIRDAASRLDDQFLGAVNAILNCNDRVCVTGVGKAGLIGQKIQATLASTGTPAYSLHPVEALHGDLGMVKPGDVVIALSKSGSSELVELLPRLRDLDCRIILLTANRRSAAAEVADFVLDIGETAEACPLGLAPSASTAAMLALGDALALTVMEMKAIEPDQYAAYHPGGALGRFLMKTHELMRTGENCPSVLETDTLSTCYQRILGAPKRAGAAAVVDADGKLVGIVTQGDFFRLLIDQAYEPQRPVKDVMTASPKSVHVSARIADALNVIRRHAIDELLVVDDDQKLAGLIDVRDLLDRGFTVFESA